MRASWGQEDDFLLSQGPWVILWRKEGNQETFLIFPYKKTSSKSEATPSQVGPGGILGSGTVRWGLGDEDRVTCH